MAKSNKTGWPPTYASVDKQRKWYVNITGNILQNNSKDELINVTFYNTFSNYYPLYMNDSIYSAADYIDVIANRFWLTDSLTGGG